MNIQKKHSAGFTLVELIVVITILVILGTIAFVNLGGMSATARDSQRTSDINQINKMIMNLQAKNGTSYTSMLSGTTISTFTSISLAGSGVTNSPDKYNAGDVNYMVLWIDQSKFQDPTSKKKYDMGATSLVWGVYQVAASLEESPIALVIGTYIARGTGTTASGSFDATNKTINITTGLGLFKVNDWITSWWTTAQVTSISGDLKTLYLNGSITSGSGIRLTSPETGGLIRSIDGTNPVLDKGNALPY
jgi:prepilin-type N-terminal cleavage/methylation domain-containing protein